MSSMHCPAKVTFLRSVIQRYRPISVRSCRDVQAGKTHVNPYGYVGVATARWQPGNDNALVLGSALDQASGCPVRYRMPRPCRPTLLTLETFQIRQLGPDRYVKRR